MCQPRRCGRTHRHKGLQLNLWGAAPHNVGSQGLPYFGSKGSRYQVRFVAIPHSGGLTTYGATAAAITG